MLSRATDSYHVYLTGSAVHARRRISLFRRRIDAAGMWPWQAAMPASLDLRRLNPNNESPITLHVHVGAALSKLMTLALPQDLHREEEVQRVAQAQMRDQLGLQPMEWEIAVDAPTAGMAVACAVRRNVMQAIRDAANGAGLKLRSVRPYAATIWNAVQEKSRTGQPMSALVVVESDAYSLLVEKDGKLVSASAMPHLGRFDLIERDLQRLALTHAEITAESILVAAGDEGAAALRHGAHRRVRRTEFLNQDSYPDFRDLLFATEEP